MIQIILVLLAIASPFSRGFSFEYELAICAIFQDEDRFLDEWINHHVRHGVQHFWLYNNNSTDAYRIVLHPYIESGLVELIDWPSSPQEKEWEHFCFVIQPGAYNDGINRAKHKAKWLAIIDTDEFMLPMKGSMHDLLRKYRKEKAIALQWACFGTSNVDYCPSGEMLNLLVWRLPLDHPRNGWYKSIVKPLYIASCRNPHFCDFVHGKEKVLPREEARLNHYWARDEAFLHGVKVPRYEKWGGNREVILDEAANMNQIYDDSIKESYAF